MIDDEIIDRLVPPEQPPESSGVLPEMELSEPQIRMALWTNYVISKLREHLNENDALREELDYTSFVGIGISRGSARAESASSGFDQFAGYQFAVHLLQSTVETEDLDVEGSFRNSSFQISGTPFSIPILRSEILQMRNGGRTFASIAALVEHKGDRCFLTAGHVVEGRQIGDRLRGMSWDCCDLHVRKTPVGRIDAGLLEAACGSPCLPFSRGQVVETRHQHTDRLTTSQPVRAHLGKSRSTPRCSISMTVYPDKSILNSAALAEFFITDYGQKGDSGSLVCSDHGVGDPSLCLLGVYCGMTTVEHGDGTRERWGHVLDIKDATRILRANIKGGVFNV